MIVGGENRPTTRCVVQVLGHRPGDREPVVGARATPDLVEDHERTLGRTTQDGGRFGHLDHEGALPAGERLYHTWCARCHGSGGVSSSGLPDLRESLSRLGENFDTLSLHGLPGTGMPDMGRFIDESDTALIRRYLESRAEVAGVHPLDQRGEGHLSPPGGP